MKLITTVLTQHFAAQPFPVSNHRHVSMARSFKMIIVISILSVCPDVVKLKGVLTSCNVMINAQKILTVLIQQDVALKDIVLMKWFAKEVKVWVTIVIKIKNA